MSLLLLLKGTAATGGVGAAAPFPHLSTLFEDRTLAAGAGTFTVTGQPAGLSVPVKVLGAWAGSFNLTGVAATLAKGSRRIIADAGAFSLSGKTATLKYGHRLVSAAGSFALSGQAATLSYVTPESFFNPAPLPHLSSLLAPSVVATFYPAPLPHLSSLLAVGAATVGGVEAPAPLPMWSGLLGESSAYKFIAASAGSFALTGQTAALLYGRHLDGEAGAFALAGAPAERDMEMDPLTGAFAVSGVDALLKKGPRTLQAGARAFVLNFNPAALNYQFPTTILRLSALPGQFVVTGVDVDLVPTPHLYADPGQFTVGSSGADLRYSGEKKYGKSRKRKKYEKRYVVEIDGEEFVVESPEEAKDLLEAAKATLPEAAPVKAPRIRAKGPVGPELTELVDTVAQERDEIRKMFNELQQIAEIQRLLQEQDDEEALLALL